MTNVSAIAPSTLAVVLTEHGALLKAAEATAIIVEKKNQIPFLTGLLLRAAGTDAIEVIGSTGDIETRVVVACEAVDSRFAVVVPAARLLALLKKGDRGSLVTLSAPITPTEMPAEGAVDSASSLTVRMGSTEVTLDGYCTAPYPILGIGDKPSAAFSISGSTLHAGLDNTLPGVSTEETHYYLNGIFMHAVDDDIRFVSTDGHRLHRQTFEAPAGAKKVQGVIIPNQVARLVHKLTKGKACPVEVAVATSADRIFFAWGALRIIAKPIDGTFPDYQRVIPIANQHEILLDSDRMLKAIDVVSAISEERGRAVRLEVGVDEIAVVLREPGGATARQVVPITKRNTDDVFEIGFNARYLRQCLMTTCPAGEPVTMQLSDPGSPGIIRGTSPRLSVTLMPMRI